MGYVMFSARKQYLTSKINTINAQLTMLTEAQSSMQTNISNSTRKMSCANMYNKLLGTLSTFMGCNNNFGNSSIFNNLGNYGSNMLSCLFGGLGNMSGFGNSLSGLLGCGGGYNAMPLTNDWLQYAPEFLQNSLIENDIDQQKTALETQLKAATKELESVEKAEDAAIQRSTPKYA